jgi:hypothetical protein
MFLKRISMSLLASVFCSELLDARGCNRGRKYTAAILVEKETRSLRLRLTVANVGSN